MSAHSRAVDRGSRRGEQFLRLFADEVHAQRQAVGISQAGVAVAAGLSRPTYGRVERGKRPALTIVEASRIAAVLGLDLAMRLYPGGDTLRDEAQQSTLRRLIVHARPPISWRAEVPLPALGGRPEQRAWDAVLACGDERTAVEVETRVRDGQALERRLSLKRRDDPTDRFLLVLADTRTNRRVLIENPGLLADLPRLRRRDVISALRGGRLPPTGLVLI